MQKEEPTIKLLVIVPCCTSVVGLIGAAWAHTSPGGVYYAPAISSAWMRVTAVGSTGQKGHRFSMVHFDDVGAWPNVSYYQPGPRGRAATLNY